MLNKANILEGYQLNSLDGEMGVVRGFYFDDHYWAVRYLVADPGNWHMGRQVLISPYALGAVNKKEKQVTVNLSRKQIEDSPAIDKDKPLSSQFEEAYYGYYGWPIYWAGQHMWGAFPHIVRDREKWRETIHTEKAWTPHLCSTLAVTGYHIQAIDDEIGHVEDFVIDDETWAIRYLIIDTKNWWSGKKVLVSTKWIEKISWDQSKVFINLSCEDIKKSPEYTKETLLTREYETELHRHYNCQGYWADEPLPGIIPDESKM